MPLYSEDLIEEVRSGNDIVDLISGYVKLQKKGSTYFGLCPFHSEKTPSFSVTPSKQMYYCFGCGAGGNAITFLMEYENFSFVEAMQALAERAGIKLPEREYSPQMKQEADRKQRLLEVNREAGKYYYMLLRSEHGRQAMEYFKKRGLTEQTMRGFGLGSSDKFGEGLYRYLRQKGYEDELLRDSGLVVYDEKRGGHDRFWNRAMFPIMNVHSKIIGFGGRVMGEGEPKYLNSPETMIFDKSRNLYGLHIARATKKPQLILCEGYMDVIALHQAGFSSAVASLGTAFTELQANLMRRYTKEILLTYDSDGAGQKAALRAIPILRKAGLNAKIVNMEPYKDPDEFIKGLGAEAFEERLKTAQNSFFFEAEVAKNTYDMADPEQKTAFYHELAKKLLVFTDKVQRDNYLEAVAAKYTIRKEDLRELVIRYSSRMPEGYEAKRPARELKSSRKTEEAGIEYSYRLLLSWLVEDTSLYEPVSRFIKPEDFCEENYRTAASMLYEQLAQGEVLPAKIINYFQDVEQQKMAAQMFQTSFQADMGTEEKEKALNELIIRIKEYSIDHQIRNLTDMSQLQRLILEKKQWQTPDKLHISLKDG